MSSSEIREAFFQHYASKDHLFVRSAPVFPKDDPTVLFVNSGMMQFKSIFLGENPKNYKRVYNSQKVLRVSGKHNDLDEVGRDNYHHTFFEMLGHWSFGDYFKKEAIIWGWELMTEVFKIPKNRLFASVHISDDESEKIWKEHTDIEPHRVLRFDKDNFWEMGNVGPCGPSTELHFDLGDLETQKETYANKIEGVNGQNHRYVELINFVFMQNERLPDGSLKNLSNKHVDTGGGFERICSVIQGSGSNYETDLFEPILDKIAQLSGVPYKDDDTGTPHRVVADHIRAVTFAVADGLTPGNEGRGYVIRRILRRAIKFANELGQKEPFLYKLVDSVVSIMGGAFPEISERQTYIEQVVEAEENRFLKTLDQGLARLNKKLDTLKQKNQKVLAGEEVFSLYDTFGFPTDLTALIAEEQGISIDVQAYDECMTEQRERARSAQKFDDGLASDENWTILSPSKTTEFVGYSSFESETQTLRFQENGDKIFIILNKTPFYAEAGGQAGDTGTLQNESIELAVEDTVKVFDMTVHQCSLVSGLLNAESVKHLKASISAEKRQNTMRHHSATHLLNAALKLHLGEHVTQQGSLCDADRLRFDFTHHETVSRKQLDAIEDTINQKIRENLPIETALMAFDDAKKVGATALFGEKYGDTVRVLSMGDFSKELCGGTHAKSTGELGYFKITSEASIAAGVRRIEAAAGDASARLVRSRDLQIESVCKTLKSKPSQIAEKVASLAESLKAKEKEIKELKQLKFGLLTDTIVSQKADFNGIDYLAYDLQAKNVEKDDLQLVLDAVSEKLPTNAVSVLTHEFDGQTSILATVSKDLHKKIKAGDLVKELATLNGGQGGGRPDKARAGIKQPGIKSKILSDAKKIVSDRLS